MPGLIDAIKDLRETLEYVSEDNIGEFSDEQIVEYASDHISNLELVTSLYEVAIEHNIHGADFDRWFDLAVEKLGELDDDEQLEEADLLALLKQTRN